MEKQELKINVVTWNLLSPDLVDPANFFTCKPEHLDPVFRWGLIEQNLLRYMKMKAILSLQELSDEWISKLFCLFNKHSYTFYYDSKQLGLGIAFPTNEYTLHSVRTTCLGTYIDQHITWKQVNLQTKSWSVLNLFQKWNCFNKGNEKEKQDPWVLASKRRNCVLEIFLSTPNFKTFGVFNYHMPCMFWNVDVMNIHATALKQLCDEHAKEQPYILCSDMNSTQNSNAVKVVLGYACCDLPKSKLLTKYPDWEICQQLISAHVELQCIPRYTCHTITERSKKVPFSEQIDYIFSTTHFEPLSVLPVPITLPLSYYPNENEPSDHIPLGVCLLLSKVHDQKE